MGKYGSPFRSGYAAAKHALHGFFDVMRMEHQKDNIYVTMICPGFVRTPIAMNSLRGDGSVLGVDDLATRKGMKVEDFAKKCFERWNKKNGRFLLVVKKDWEYFLRDCQINYCTV